MYMQTLYIQATVLQYCSVSQGGGAQFECCFYKPQHRNATDSTRNPERNYEATKEPLLLSNYRYYSKSNEMINIYTSTALVLPAIYFNI